MDKIWELLIRLPDWVPILRIFRIFTKRRIKDLHTDCDRKFFYFVQLKQTVSELYGMTQEDPKIPETKIKKHLHARTFVLTTSQSDVFLEKPKVKLFLPKAIKIDVDNVWKRIQQIADRFNHTRTWNARSVEYFHEPFPETERQFMDLLNKINNLVNTL